MFLLLFKFTTKAQSIHGGIGDVSIDGKCSFFGRRRGLSHLFSQKDGEGPCDKMSDFRTGRILGKRFPEAQVHTVHRTSAAGTSPMDSMDECFRKMLSQNSPRAEVAFSISCHSLKVHQNQ